MQSKRLLLALSACAFCGLIPIAPAQTAMPPSSTDGKSPTALITFASGKSCRIRSQNGRFALVAASAGETVSVELRFPPGIVESANVQCLDGGVLSAGAENISLDADRLGSFRFQVGSKPGLYRVPINSGGAAATLQFWVLNPDNPRSNPATLQAQ